MCIPFPALLLPRQTTFMITNQGHGDSKSMLQRLLDSVSGPSLPASLSWHARVWPESLGRCAPVGLLVTRAWGRAERLGTTFGHMLHDFETIHFALFFVVNFYFVQVLRAPDLCAVAMAYLHRAAACSRRGRALCSALRLSLLQPCWDPHMPASAYLSMAV